MLSVFHSQISTLNSQDAELESQIAALEAQIAANKQRRILFSEAEFTVDGAIKALKAAIEEVAAKAPEAIASLEAGIKLAVENLIGGDRGPSDGGGNQPISPSDPDPVDGNANQPEEIQQPEPDTMDAQPNAAALDSSPTDADQLTNDFQAEVEARGIQKTELMPKTTDWYDEAAQSDAQAKEGDLLQAEPVDQQEFAELVKVSDAIAYMHKFNGEIMATYVGFNNKGNAESLARHLATINQASIGSVVRQPKRLLDFKYEVKILGLSNEGIQRLLAIDLTKPITARAINDLMKKPACQQDSVVEATGKQLECPKIEVEDIVASKLVPAWTFKVLEINDELGILKCERLGIQPPLTINHAKCDVTLISKGKAKDQKQDAIASDLAEKEQSSEERALELTREVEEQLAQQAMLIDETDVPVSITLRRSDDYLSVEYYVWAWVIKRAKGVPTPEEVCIGRIVQNSLNSISAYTITGRACGSSKRTFDAVSDVIGASDYSAADIEKAFKQKNQASHDFEHLVEEHGDFISSANEEDLRLASDFDTHNQHEDTIEEEDWVELIATGETFQVSEVSGTEIGLAIDSGTKFVSPSEVRLVFKKPSNFAPF